MDQHKSRDGEEGYSPDCARISKELHFMVIFATEDYGAREKARCAHMQLAAKWTKRFAG